MRYTKLLLLVALSTLTFSCKKEIELFETGDKGAINEITATFADLNTTKTVIGSDNTSVLWNPGDEIKIFYGASNVKFTSVNTIPSASSIFTSEKSIMFIGGEGSNDYIWGVYPYSDNTQYNDNSINITVPSAQTAFEGSFAPGSFPSIGRSKTTAIPFYNVCGGVMFSVTRDDISSVTFRGKNNETIAGSANVSFNDDDVPEVSSFTAEAKQITAYAPDGGCFKPGVKYFIVAFPASLTQGWVLTYNKPTTCAKIESSSAVSIKRSVFAKVEGKDAGVPFGPKEGNIEFACPIAKQACVAKFDANADGEVSYAEVYNVTNITDLFANHTGVTSFEELKYFVSVTNLSNCFKDCNKIKTLTIPDNIEIIGPECFRNCSSLQTVNIPSSVSYIDSFVFYGCNSLDNRIIIPASVQCIGQCTFDNSGVDTVIMMSNTPPVMVYDQTFSNNTIIYIPRSGAEQYKSDEHWSIYKDNFRYIYSGANCFLVPYYGYSMFYCTKKGNSDESVGEVASVDVLWESFGTGTTPNVGDVVYDVKYENGQVGFSTKNDGNAVIAAKDDSGNILWSWHIWVCKDFDPEATAQVYNNNAGTLMDRNLGATSAAKGDVHSLGLLYQWGRKDPFLGGEDIGSTEKAKSTNTWPGAVTTSASIGTVDYAVSHPMTFIGSSGIGWQYSRDGGLWQPTKTKYDPCPEGWRVPDGYGNSPLTAVWLKAFNKRVWTTASNYDSTNKGMDFGTTDVTLGSGTIWYPCCGYLFYTNGQLSWVGTEGAYWSRTPDYNGSWLLQFSSSGYVGSLNLCRQGALGCSVRCQKE